MEWDAHAAAMDMLPYSNPTIAPGYFNGKAALMKPTSLCLA